MLLYCRLKVTKMSLERICCLTVSTNGKSTRLGHKLEDFCFFWLSFGCGWLWMAEKLLQKKRWFFIFVVMTRLFTKAMRVFAAKLHNCRYLVLEKNIQNVAAGFAPFTVVETRRSIGSNVSTLFISTCWTIHISYSLFYFVVHTYFFLLLFGWLEWDIREQLSIG